MEMLPNWRDTEYDRLTLVGATLPEDFYRHQYNSSLDEFIKKVSKWSDNMTMLDPDLEGAGPIIECSPEGMKLYWYPENMLPGNKLPDADSYDYTGDKSVTISHKEVEFFTLGALKKGKERLKKYRKDQQGFSESTKTDQPYISFKEVKGKIKLWIP
ncbi:MAG: hypothetical protein WD335_01215 [Candidatus Paceibacterota bacterium]